MRKRATKIAFILVAMAAIFGSFVLLFNQNSSENSNVIQGMVVSAEPGSINFVNYGVRSAQDYTMGEIRAFNGAGYAATGDSDELSISYTGRFSISAWVYSENASGFIIAKGASPNQWEYGLEVRDANSLRFRVWPADGSRNHASLIIPGFSLKEWHNVIITIDEKNKLKAYVDGKLVVQNNNFVGSIRQGNQPLLLGRRSDGYYFRGKIGEVKIWNRVISESEIRAEYSKTLVGEEVPPLTPVGLPKRTICTYGTVNWTADRVFLNSTGVNCVRGNFKDVMNNIDNSYYANFGNSIVQYVVFNSLPGDKNNEIQRVDRISKKSLNYTKIKEYSIDDFIATQEGQNEYGAWSEDDINNLVDAIKENNPAMGFGITLYEDQLTDNPDYYRGYDDNVFVSSDVRNKIDVVHFYYHSRINCKNMNSDILKVNEYFPNAQILIGIYTYDRSSKEGDYSDTVQINQFKACLTSAKLLMDNGNVAGVEFFRGDFGRESKNDNIYFGNVYNKNKEIIRTMLKV